MPELLKLGRKDSGNGTFLVQVEVAPVVKGNESENERGKESEKGKRNRNGSMEDTTTHTLHHKRRIRSNTTPTTIITVKTKSQSMVPRTSHVRFRHRLNKDGEKCEEERTRRIATSYRELQTV